MGAATAGHPGRRGRPAGFGNVELVPEPVAAAQYFTSVLGHQVPEGTAVVVYDLGGGTFDISVVRRLADGGWKVAASAGLDDVGGVDMDAVIVDRVLRALDEPAQQRLAHPQSLADLRHRLQLWDDARSVKEQLSRGAVAGMPLPLADRDVHVTREEFEELTRPLLERTITLTTATLFTSGVNADHLAGVFLVGGATRVPQVATLLHRALGVPPVVIEQPELVVGRGSVVSVTALVARPATADVPRSTGDGEAPEGPARPVPSSPREDPSTVIATPADETPGPRVDPQPEPRPVAAHLLLVLVLLVATAVSALLLNLTLNAVAHDLFYFSWHRWQALWILPVLAAAACAVCLLVWTVGRLVHGLVLVGFGIVFAFWASVGVTGEVFTGDNTAGVILPAVAMVTVGLLAPRGVRSDRRRSGWTLGVVALGGLAAGFGNWFAALKQESNPELFTLIFYLLPMAAGVVGSFALIDWWQARRSHPRVWQADTAVE
ncbi:Hsp70 family protein [Dactylosporangium cerinum]